MATLSLSSQSVGEKDRILLQTPVQGVIGESKKVFLLRLIGGKDIIDVSLLEKAITEWIQSTHLGVVGVDIWEAESASGSEERLTQPWDQSWDWEPTQSGETA